MKAIPARPQRTRPASQRIGAWPLWMRWYAMLMLLVAAGHDFIGGELFENAFTYLLLLPMLALILLLPLCAFSLLLGLLGRRS